MSKVVVKPRIKGFICTTAHARGCELAVAEQVAYAEAHPLVGRRPKNVLLLGGSTGYGLASRIGAAFSGGANTLSVFFERSAQGERTASAGWYNSIAFEKMARAKGLLAESINGDAFSDEIKQATIQRIREHFAPIDLIIYSLASPRRTHPKTGEMFRSALKPIGQPFVGKSVNTDQGVVTQVSIDPANSQEIEQTINVMGGEDWELWIDALLKAGVLARDVMTVNYSYIGPELTWPIYKDGTIGRAKDDIYRSSKKIDRWLEPLNGRALISVNKAVVTQASSAIPVVPLYISLLFKIMKEKNLHEDCIEQMQRLFSDHLYAEGGLGLDDSGLIRLDDWEMRADVQAEVRRRWPLLTTENLRQETDFDGYQKNFLRLFGFDIAGVDYDEPIEIGANFEEEV